MPEIDRELTEQDLQDWRESAETHPARENPQGGLQKVRDRHHWLARLMATGDGPTEAAHRLGMEPARVSVLQKDETFQQLLTYYREKEEAAFDELSEIWNSIHRKAALEINDSLEVDPSDWDRKELIKVAQLAADRTGYGPQSKTEHEHKVRSFADLTREEKAALAKEMEEMYGRERLVNRVIEHGEAQEDNERAAQRLTASDDE